MKKILLILAIAMASTAAHAAEENTDATNQDPSTEQQGDKSGPSLGNAIGGLFNGLGKALSSAGNTIKGEGDKAPDNTPKMRRIVCEKYRSLDGSAPRECKPYFVRLRDLPFDSLTLYVPVK